jgi:hypothetical protein
MLFLALLIQAASEPPPDIQFQARVTARDVRIERSGEASLTVRAVPDAGSDVRVESPAAPQSGRLRNVTVTVDAEARIADPRQNREPAETTEPQ